ncbi:MAG: PHP domain-containing protein, partial [Candidatus Marinimicrobia bacterium]|nr:PHP domain-containing protein [Candidatus Neomarinimicrobiota bacterium]
MEHGTPMNGASAQNIFLDLHVHSSFSDGTLDPQDLIALAKRRGCEYIAIADHDNVDHISHTGTIPGGITYLPAVEISAEFPGTLHILAYGFDPGHEELGRTLRSLQEARRQRNAVMLEKMAGLGFDIGMEELAGAAVGGMAGRPHFANLMLAKGYVNSYQEAFDNYLAKGRPLYMDKQRLEPEAAIRLIRAAGGIPVLAHPYQTKLEGEALEELVVELISYGLRGIEAYYSRHTREQTAHYVRLANDHQLLITAGSDFHGTNKA